jgi:hypothetical protein
MCQSGLAKLQTNRFLGGKMKKLTHRAIAISAAIAMVLGFATAANADAWVVTWADAPDGSMVAAITEVNEWGSVSSRQLLPSKPPHRGDLGLCPVGVTAEGICSLSDGETMFLASQILPVCASDAQENCVEGLRFGVDGSELAKASYVRNVAGQTYPAGDRGLYEGSTVSIWDAPGLPHAGGATKYVVQVKTEMTYDPFSKTYYAFELMASILPFNQKSGNYKASKLVMDTQSGRLGINGWGMSPGCAYTEDGFCGAVQDFADKSRFELSLRISNEITGWFRGRIQDPAVSIEKFSSTNNRIVMTATSVKVPRFATLVSKSTTSDRGVALLTNSSRTGPLELFKGNTVRNVAPHYNGIQWIEEFRAGAKDTAAGESTLWNFSTLAGGGENNACFADKSRVVGVVTTSATAMEPATPEFKNGLLTYKVAGLHYAPDGKTLNEGSYDLVMRSDVARCLYGFSKAPLSATVSVIGEGGENKVATTVVSEKDGWLKLAAYGFTFSSPTISVKLSQAKAPAKKTTITCVKGKLTKKITAVGPKCPAGYKKK